MKQQCSLSLKKQKKRLLIFHNHINNGNTKIVNLLDGSYNKNSKFAIKNGMLLTVSQKVTIYTLIQ